MKRFTQHCRLFFAALALFSLTRCMGELQNFLDEDKEMSVTIVGDALDSIVFSAETRTVSFTLSLESDRNGTFSVLHGNSCSGSARNLGAQGVLLKNATATSSFSISFDDILLYGKEIVVCSQDVAAYRKNTLVKNFASALSTALDTETAKFNGKGGTSLNSAVTGEFYLFQSSWVGNAGSTGNNGVLNPFSHAVFIDPNDAYKIKYFVVDRDNHRVLIFNQLPSSSASTADAVVGQNNFADGAVNGGMSVGAQGFNSPVHVSVSPAGHLYISDFNNNRILGYNSIPQTNGVLADFVLGQENFSSNAPDGAVSSASDLDHPYASYSIDGKFYIVDQGNNRIVVHNTIPTANADGDFVIGQFDFSTTTSGTDYGSVSSYLHSPFALAVDAGKLFISDTENHRVLVFDSLPSASDAKPDFVIGQVNATQKFPNQNQAIPTSQYLNYPRGLAIQGENLAVADQDNNRILFFALPITANDSAAAHKIGQGMQSDCSFANCSSAGFGITKAYFNKVRSVILDGNFAWATDGDNNRVQRLATP